MSTHIVDRGLSIRHFAPHAGGGCSFDCESAATVNAASPRSEVLEQANVWRFFEKLVAMPEQDRIALLNACQLMPIQDQPNYYPYPRPTGVQHHL